MPGPDDPRTDEQLLAAINGGDDHAFEALYYRYRDWIVSLAHRFTANHDDALDVLQEVFAYLVRKTPGLNLTARMTTFLYPVVKNLAIAARRKRRRFDGDELDVLAHLPARDEQTSSTRSDLAAVMSSLGAGHQEVLLLRFVDDFSLDEIAAVLSIPLGTVKSRLHNALEMLRRDPKAAKFFQKE